MRTVTFTQRTEDHRVSSRGRGTRGRGDRARMPPPQNVAERAGPPVRADVHERLRRKVADKAMAAADKAKAAAEEASVGARAARHELGTRDAAMRSAQMFPMKTPEVKTLVNSGFDMQKTIAEVFEQCGMGPPIENPL